jgi:molybdopterin-guanine dinucleotide biosynthesis protein A
MKPSCSGIILSGGENKRFKGKNKSFNKIGGRTIIDRIYGIFDEIFDDIILVTNDPTAYLGRDCTIVTDIYPFRSSLTGIHAGLFYSRHPFAFFAACDTPFLKESVVLRILCAIEEKYDVILPETSSGLEPLCAAYSKRSLVHITRNLENQTLKIQSFFNKIRLKKIPEEIIRESDPELLSFFNINTPADLEKAEQIYQSHKGNGI